jgi:DNA-binding beta-propeller fold protein YncE
MTFDPVNGYLYVNTPNCCSTNITVINPSTNRVVALVPLPTYSIGPIAADTATGVVYAGDTVATVYAISPSTNQIVGTVPLEAYGCPYGCAPDVQTYDAANGDIYVTDIVDDNVSVIHGMTGVAAVPVGVSPNGAAYDSANGEVFVSNEGATIPANLTVIDGTTNRVIGQVYHSGNGPGVTYDSSNGDVYTCTNGDQANFSNVVSVANGTTNRVVASIPISSACGAATYDPANDYVYVTDRDRPGGQYLSNVTLIDPGTNRIVATLPVQEGPIPIAYDPVNHNVYVGNAVADTVSVLPQIYRLTVRETGLPNGSNWSVTIGGTTLSSTTPTIAFPEQNGSFKYTVPSVTAANSTNGMLVTYTASPSAGTVSVSGGPQGTSVRFCTNATACRPSSSGPSGLTEALGYYVLGGGFAALLVAGTVSIFVFRRRDRRVQRKSPSPPRS